MRNSSFIDAFVSLSTRGSNWTEYVTRIIGLQVRALPSANQVVEPILRRINALIFNPKTEFGALKVLEKAPQHIRLSGELRCSKDELLRVVTHVRRQSRHWFFGQGVGESLRDDPIMYEPSLYLGVLFVFLPEACVAIKPADAWRSVSLARPIRVKWYGRRVRSAYVDSAADIMPRNHQCLRPLRWSLDPKKCSPRCLPVSTTFRAGGTLRSRES